ncbi:MAG: hypothetical protein OK456_09940, partial [Thaumarchaeota archaeon]|nr:hypothetical protein [Nitrososphaerota archaeon]
PPGQDQNKTQEKQKKCDCTLDDKSSPQSMALNLGLDSVSPGPECWYSAYAQNQVGSVSSMGFDLDIRDRAANYGPNSPSTLGLPPCVVLSALAEKFRLDELTSTFLLDGAVQSQSQMTAQIPLAGAEYEWVVDKVVLKSSKTGRTDPPKVMLQGVVGSSGQKVSGRLAILPFNYYDCYEDWFVPDSNPPCWEGKFVDFDVNLTCTAKLGGESQSKKMVVHLTGVKLGDKGKQRDMYHIAWEQPPLEEMFGLPDDAGQTEGSVKSAWNNLGGCPLEGIAWDYSRTGLTAVGATSVTILGGSAFTLAVKPTISDSVTVTTKAPQDGCPGAKLTIEDVQTAPVLMWSVVSPDPSIPMREVGGAEAGDWTEALYVSPPVEKETKFAVRCQRTTGQSELVGPVVEFAVTVEPCMDMPDWFTKEHLLKKVVEPGIIAPEDVVKMQAGGTPTNPDIWRYSDIGLGVVGFTVKTVRGVNSASNRFTALPKSLTYYYEIFDKLKVLPGFAPIPSAEFSKLHPLKRVIEPLVGTKRLADLLVDADGTDYFYPGGTPETFDKAWLAYFNNVQKKDYSGSQWEVLDKTYIDKFSSNVRFDRLQQTMATRVNEIVKMQLAEEMGAAYAPKVPISGKPVICLQKWGDNYELNFIYNETTKLDTVESFKITVQVETEIVNGAVKVKQTGKFVNFVMGLQGDQRVANNRVLAERGVPRSSQYFAPKADPSKVPLEVRVTDYAIQSWKDWAMDSTWRAGSAAAWSAGIYAVTNAYTDLFLVYQKQGLMPALGSFGKGLLKASATSFVKDYAIRLATRTAQLAPEALTAAEQAYIAAFRRQFVTAFGEAAAEGAAIGVETTIAEGLITAGRLPFMAARWGASGALRLIPIVGVGLLLYDVATMTDTLSKKLGDLLYGPERTPEQEAWSNPQYVVTQDQVDDYIILHRGMQIRATNTPSKVLNTPEAKKGGHFPNDVVINETLFEPRSTKIVFKDGTELETGDEVIGPKTEWLPKYMRDLLPDLPPMRYSGQFPSAGDMDQPYQIAQNKWYWYLTWALPPDMIKADPPSLDKLFAGGLFGSQLNPADTGYTFQLWGEWRDQYATRWTRLKYGDPSSPYVLLSWRDFQGRTCQVMTYKDKMIMQPRFDLSAIMNDVGTGNFLSDIKKLPGPK